MDRISGLSDELLIKILSLLPTKTAVSTSILSKQWEFLWMWLPKLEYSSKDYSESECERLRCFLDRNMPLHRAPVLESLRLDFCDAQFKPEDVKLWVLSAVFRSSVRELEILSSNTSPSKLTMLPSSLYTCKSLVTLKLKGTMILVDVPRSMVCLPCLKTLQLRDVTYLNGDTFQRLISNCPVLEDLLVVGCEGEDNMGKVTVIGSSLLRLSLYIPSDVDEFVINTPSLKYLKIQYYNWEDHHFLIENMPMLEEACVDVYVKFPDIERLIGSITSVKHLTLCLVDDITQDDVFGDGFVFNKLEHLQLCPCQEDSSRVLVRLLKDSPHLRVLDICKMEAYHEEEGMVNWNQPSSVPECLSSSLQTFQWSGYLGKPEERDLAVYILENARVLKTATISSKPGLVSSHDMLKELALCSRASNKCRLLFESS